MITSLDWTILQLKTSPNFHIVSNLTIDTSLEISFDEFSDFSIELQIGVPYESNVSHRRSDSPNDEFLFADSVIGVYLDLLVTYDLSMHRSLNFSLNESSLVDSTNVMNTVEDFRVDNTCIQVTINRSIPRNLLQTTMVLFFLRYKTLICIRRHIRIGMPPISP